MQQRREMRREHARSRASNNEDDARLPVAVKKVNKLQLESPQQEEEEENHQLELESRSSRSRAESITSYRSTNSSIYDYLDALESESALQLPSIASRASSAPSYRARPSRKPAKEFAWEEDTTNCNNERSRSCRSSISRDDSNNLHQYYIGVKEKLATITIELNDKTKTIELLKMARNKDATKTKQLLAEAEVQMNKQLAIHQQKFNKELEKQMDFAQNLVTDKSKLAKRCEELVLETQKATANATREAERFKLKLKDAKQRWNVQEKLRRDQWIVKKTEEIKKSTVAALEPDIQLILREGKTDLEKARETANEERRKLQLQLEKEREFALQNLQEEYERKLVEAREKERAKLMTRLDAADAELQQQLSSQRRRLQEEGETMRNELHAELRTAKLANAKEMDELKEQQMQKLQIAAEKLHKEKQEVTAKFEREFAVLREKATVECEQFKAQLSCKLRDEMEREKREVEKQMLQTRDAKIELVIAKLQEKSRQMVFCAERKAQKKFSNERADFARKLKQTGEIEGVWMEKNRELHEKLKRMERMYEEVQRENEALGQDLRQTGDESSDLARHLHEERRQHEDAMAQLQKRCTSLQTDNEYATQQQNVELTVLREKQASMESHFQLQVQKLRDEHETALANLHERVKATIARKDEVIADLQEESHLMQVKLDKSYALIEEQRTQLFSQ